MVLHFQQRRFTNLPALDGDPPAGSVVIHDTEEVRGRRGTGVAVDDVVATRTQRRNRSAEPVWSRLVEYWQQYNGAALVRT